MGAKLSHDVPQVIVEIEGLARFETDEIKEELRREGERVAGYARTIAPVYHGPSRPDKTPGEYRDSIHYEDYPDRQGFLPKGMVITRDPIANLLEFGTRKMHEFGTFATTAAHFGGTGPDLSGGHIDAGAVVI